jgi:hypothetical protein
LHTFKALVAGAVFALALMTVAVAAEHPANGRLISDVPEAYGTASYGLPSGWSHGDLTFGGPYPAADSLSPPERYMLAGAQPTTENGADGLPAWIEAAADFCLDYHSVYGRLPEQLTADSVQELRRLQGLPLSAADKALSLNPLTNTAPRLNARIFSAGDLYVRMLSADEMHYFAQRRPALDDAWFKGRSIDPSNGRVGRVELLTGVLYVRAYGASGVIYENLVYRLSDPDYPPQPASSTATYSSNRDSDDWSLVEDCPTSGG